MTSGWDRFPLLILFQWSRIAGILSISERLVAYPLCCNQLPYWRFSWWLPVLGPCPPQGKGPVPTAISGKRVPAHISLFFLPLWRAVQSTAFCLWLFQKGIRHHFLGPQKFREYRSSPEVLQAPYLATVKGMHSISITLPVTGCLPYSSISTLLKFWGGWWAENREAENRFPVWESCIGLLACWFGIGARSGGSWHLMVWSPQQGISAETD